MPSVAEAAARLGVRLILPDRPGIGLSDFKPGRAILDWPADVLALADALNLPRFALMGLSGGGPYAAACAYKIPQRLTPRGHHQRCGAARYARRHGSFSTAPATVRRSGSAPSRPGCCASCWRTPSSSSAATPLSWWRRPPRRSPRPTRLPWRSRRGGHRGAHDRRRLPAGGARRRLGLHPLLSPVGLPLGDIHLPVYLWHGEDDWICPVEMGRYMAQGIPGCNAAFYPARGISRWW